MRTIAENLLEAVSGNDVLSLLLNWRDIVGKQTARISIPVGADASVLTIAVPNNMVKQQLSYLSTMIVETINRKQHRRFKTVRFRIRPSLFSKGSPRSAGHREKHRIHVPDSVHRKKRDTFIKRGISPKMSDLFADIEAILEKKNHTDT